MTKNWLTMFYAPLGFSVLLGISACSQESESGAAVKDEVLSASGAQKVSALSESAAMTTESEMLFAMDTFTESEEVTAALDEDFPEAMRAIRRQMRNVSSQQKHVILGGVSHYLDLRSERANQRSAWITQAAQEYANLLALELVNRDNPDWTKLERESVIHIGFERKNLYEFSLSAEVEEALADRLQTDIQQLDYLEILLIGINELDGYQEVLDEVLSNFDFEAQLASQLETRGYMRQQWGNPQALAASVIKARGGDAESIQNLITGYEAMNQGSRITSFYLLSLVKQPEITRYLLSYALSDELTDTPGVNSPIAWLPAEALIKAQSTYPHYDFRWEAIEVMRSRSRSEPRLDSIAHRTLLAREWIEENIDPELLEDITVFSY